MPTGATIGSIGGLKGAIRSLEDSKARPRGLPQPGSWRCSRAAPTSTFRPAVRWRWFCTSAATAGSESERAHVPCPCIHAAAAAAQTRPPGAHPLSDREPRLQLAIHPLFGAESDVVTRPIRLKDMPYPIRPAVFERETEWPCHA